jgi:hypothetical protein
MLSKVSVRPVSIHSDYPLTRTIANTDKGFSICGSRPKAYRDVRAYCFHK